MCRGCAAQRYALRVYLPGLDFHAVSTWFQVAPVSVGLHVAVSAEALDRRLAEKDGASWDYFSDVERDMEDGAVRQRRERYYSKSAPLLQSLSAAGKIRTVSANVSMDTCVSQAASMLSASFAPVVALVLGGAGSGSSALASKLADELGWSHLSLDALPTMLMDAGQEAGLTACELLAAGKMLPQPVVLSLFKAAMAISGAPGYLVDGLSSEAVSAFAAEVRTCFPYLCRCCAAQHCALCVRLPGL